MELNAIVEVGDLRHQPAGEVTVAGWLERVRVHGKVAFLQLRDGTGVLQGVVARREVAGELWDMVREVGRESALLLSGSVREEARAPGGYEMGVSGLSLVGASLDYPIQPKEHGVEFLLDHRHLWLRSRRQRAVLRIRAQVEQAIHDFFYHRGFVRIDTPILTGSIGESAGTLFRTDYFGETAYLAQTGQLYLEAACPAFRKVYSFGPTFRAEKSKTRRHLTEFWMVEAGGGLRRFRGEHAPAGGVRGAYRAVVAGKNAWRSSPSSNATCPRWRRLRPPFRG